jgi:hypothetical protein
MKLTEQCDATATGAESADYTWIYVDPDDLLPMELKFCAHHNAQHCAALKLAGWSPYRPVDGERNAKPVTV